MTEEINGEEKVEDSRRIKLSDLTKFQLQFIIGYGFWSVVFFFIIVLILILLAHLF